jgi:hypothetical protein
MGGAQEETLLVARKMIVISVRQHETKTYEDALTYRSESDRLKSGP